MRTTLNIDDDVLLAAKELARLSSRTAGEVLSELARETLERGRPRAAARNGVPLLPATPGRPVVTDELVRTLERDG